MSGEQVDKASGEHAPEKGPLEQSGSEETLGLLDQSGSCV